MTPLLCARCGRDEPLVRAHPADGRPIGLDAHGVEEAWALIDGEVVCATCQTETERHDVAARIVQAIGASFADTSTENDDDADRNAALLNYAMSLLPPPRRSAAERVMTTVDEARAPTTSAPRIGAVTVHVTGAFLTGQALQIDFSRFRDTEAAIEAHLRGKSWQHAALRQAEAGTYASGGGFSEPLPREIARWNGPLLAPENRGTLHLALANDPTWTPFRDRGWVLATGPLRVDFYDFGVGVFDGALTLTTEAASFDNQDVEAFKRAVDLRLQADNQQHTALARVFIEAARKRCGEFTNAVAEAVRSASTRGKGTPPPVALAADSLGQASARDVGRLLWLHPVHHVVDARGQADPGDLLGQESVPVDDLAGGRFAPGIGSSVYVTRMPKSELSALNLTLLMWAVHAYSMQTDRALSDLIGGRDDDAAKMPALETAAESAFSSYVNVSQVRARIASVLAERGGDEQRAWDAIADVQCLPALSQGIDRKLALVREISERRAQRASTLATRRTNLVLTGLACLAIASTLVACVTFFVGDGTLFLGDGKTDGAMVGLRVCAIVAGIVVSAALFAWAYRDLWLERAQRVACGLWGKAKRRVRRLINGA